MGKVNFTPPSRREDMEESGAGGPNYNLDEAKGDIIYDKFGKAYLRRKNHK